MHVPLIVPGDRIALLLVDLQEEHRLDQRYLAADYEACLTRASELLAAARRAGAYIAHAQYVRDFSVVPPRPFEITGATGEPVFSDAAGGLTAICPEVAPRPGEAVFVKNDASAFAGTGLAAALRARAIGWLVIAGAWTEACVAASVRDAIAQGFRVLLVKDACTSGTALMHRAGLLNLANRLTGGAVASTAAAAQILTGERATVWRMDSFVPFRFDAANIDTLYEDL